MNSNNKIHLFVMMFLATTVLFVMTSGAITQIQAQKEDSKKVAKETTKPVKSKKVKIKKTTSSDNPSSTSSDNPSSLDSKQVTKDTSPIDSADPSDTNVKDETKNTISLPISPVSSPTGDKSTPTPPVITPPPIDQTLPPTSSKDTTTITTGITPVEVGPKVTNNDKNSTNPKGDLKNTTMSIISPSTKPVNDTNPPPVIPPLFDNCVLFPIVYHYDKSHTCVLKPNCKDGPFDKKTNNTTVDCYITVTKKHVIIQKEQPITNNYYTYTSSNTLANNLLQYLSNSPAQFLLLFDSKQLCLIAGDFQCVAQQNQFATSSLTTTYDSINKIWSISGTVKDVSKFQLNNVQVTALFYDGKGNPIGNNPITNNVIPNILNTFEDGTFAFNVSVNNDFNGINPLYIVLSYNQQNINNSGGSAPLDQLNQSIQRLAPQSTNGS
jgi:hypothetical protein